MSQIISEITSQTKFLFTFYKQLVDDTEFETRLSK